jgi:ribosomal protein S26
MSYGKNHTEDDCDKCGKRIGKDKLIKNDFLYKDMNDKSHKDLGDGYRQYYICQECYANGLEMETNRYLKRNRW